MGNSCTSIGNHGYPHILALPLTKLTAKELDAIQFQYVNQLDSTFSFNLNQFEELFGQSMIAELELDTSELFNLLDTDSNALIDAFETLALLVFLCRMRLREKVDFLFDMYDFNNSGSLNIDELTVLLRTVTYALAKIDSNVEVLETQKFREIAKKAFMSASKSEEDEIPRQNFLVYCAETEMISNFLEYWMQAVAQDVVQNRMLKLPSESNWEDSEYPAGPLCLYNDPSVPPRGCLDPIAVEWLRPKDFHPDGDFAVFSKTPCEDVSLMLGEMGSIQLLNGIRLLTSHSHYLHSLFVTTGQEKYGRYTVRLFLEGKWVCVYIDDRIPTTKCKKALFSSNENEKEFWMMLLEKALSKVHGNYERLLYTCIDTIVKECTGGVLENYRWKEEDDDNNDDGVVSTERVLELVDIGPVGLCRTTSTSADAGRDLHRIQPYHVYTVGRVQHFDKYTFLELHVPYINLEITVSNDTERVFQSRVFLDEPAIEEEMVQRLKTHSAQLYSSRFFWVEVGEMREIFDKVYFVQGFSRSTFHVERKVSKWILDMNQALLSEYSKIEQRLWMVNPQFFFVLDRSTSVYVVIDQLFTTDHSSCSSLSTKQRVPSSDSESALNFRALWNKQSNHSMGFIIVANDWCDAEDLASKTIPKPSRLLELRKDKIQAVVLPSAQPLSLERIRKRVTLGKGQFTLIPLMECTSPISPSISQANPANQAVNRAFVISLFTESSSSISSLCYVPASKKILGLPETCGNEVKEYLKSSITPLQRKKRMLQEKRELIDCVEISKQQLYVTERRSVSALYAAMSRLLQEIHLSKMKREQFLDEMEYLDG